MMEPWERNKKPQNFCMFLLVVFSRTPFCTAGDMLGGGGCVHATANLYSSLIF